MDVEKVPKTRWRLSCYLCNQRMGACIQCGNKACYQAFHVTCARKARLFLKMKNSQGTLAVVDGSTALKAFCDRHCPPDYAKENDVAHATKEAKKFYKKTMRGRLWADSQASALAMAATHRHAVTEHQPDESQLTGKISGTDGSKKGNQPQKAIWRLPSGAPVIPKYVFEIVEKSLHRFTIHKRKEYAANACQYWTLKREARRGAALLKRLQLQMETFSSMEITRRNFAGMGHSGRLKLDRRIEFARILVDQLMMIKSLSADVVQREAMKLEGARLEEDVVDTVYFPVAKYFPLIVEKALGYVYPPVQATTLMVYSRDKHTFTPALIELYTKVKARYYVTASDFANRFCNLFRKVLRSEALANTEDATDKSASAKKNKALAKRILKAAQPLLEDAVRAEAEVCGKVVETQLKELEHLLETCLQIDTPSVTLGEADLGEAVPDQDVDMPDASPSKANGNPGDIEMHDDDAPGEEVDENDIIVAMHPGLSDEDAEGEVEETINTDIQEEDVQDKGKGKQINGTKSAPTPPDTNGYVSAPEDAPNPQPSPPTPPISNKDIGNDRSETLSRGGVPWYITSFDPEGTSLFQPKDPATPFHDDLSDVEGALGVDADGEAPAPAITASPTKAKKGKAKKTPKRKR
jgi:NuA3 HAT complex component NTO1